MFDSFGLWKCLNILSNPRKPSPLQEFSVVYTDRALNHMSVPFQRVMLDIHDILCQTYGAKQAVIIPGSGTYAMEACARQFAGKKKVLVIRNGYFSFRWTQIFETGNFAEEHIVIKAQQVGGPNHVKAQYAPPAIEDVIAKIKREKPAVVFAPQVETSTGIIIDDNYIMSIADAVHSVNGILVIDAIAAGTVWAPMEKLGIDVLISAPQKSWSGPACCGFVMLSEKGIEAVRSNDSSSFSCNLGKWLEVMNAYLVGKHAYHTTMPTDALFAVRDMMLEVQNFGLTEIKERAWELGMLVRTLLCEEKGFISVATTANAAPGVVVVHADDGNIAHKMATLANMQIAAGVPFKIEEHPSTNTFRIGLFGIDKLSNPKAACECLRVALDNAGVMA